MAMAFVLLSVLLGPITLLLYSCTQSWEVVLTMAFLGRLLFILISIVNCFIAIIWRFRLIRGNKA